MVDVPKLSQKIRDSYKDYNDFHQRYETSIEAEIELAKIELLNNISLTLTTILTELKELGTAVNDVTR